LHGAGPAPGHVGLASATCFLVSYVVSGLFVQFFTKTAIATTSSYILILALHARIPGRRGLCFACILVSGTLGIAGTIFPFLLTKAISRSPPAVVPYIAPLAASLYKAAAPACIQAVWSRYSGAAPPLLYSALLARVQIAGTAIALFGLFALTAQQTDQQAAFRSGVQSLAGSLVMRAMNRNVAGVACLLKSLIWRKPLQNSEERDLILRVSLLETYTPGNTLVPWIACITLLVFMQGGDLHKQWALPSLLCLNFSGECLLDGVVVLVQWVRHRRVHALLAMPVVLGRPGAHLPPRCGREQANSSDGACPYNVPSEAAPNSFGISAEVWVAVYVSVAPMTVLFSAVSSIIRHKAADLPYGS